MVYECFDLAKQFVTSIPVAGGEQLNKAGNDIGKNNVQHLLNRFSVNDTMEAKCTPLLFSGPNSLGYNKMELNIVYVHNFYYLRKNLVIGDLVA